MNTRMLENYVVHLYLVFWKKEEQFLELEWDMNDHCTLTQHTMVNKKTYLFVYNVVIIILNNTIAV